MVLSGSKITTYRSSVTNQNSGGGNKKAGFPPVVGKSSAVSLSFHTRNIPVQLRNYQMFRLFRVPSQNLPIGFNHNIRMH